MTSVVTGLLPPTVGQVGGEAEGDISADAGAAADGGAGA